MADPYPEIEFIPYDRCAPFDYDSRAIEILKSVPDSSVVCPPEAQELSVFGEKLGYRVVEWRRRYFELKPTEIIYSKRKDGKESGKIELSLFSYCKLCNFGEFMAEDVGRLVRTKGGVPSPLQLDRHSVISVHVPQRQRTFFIALDTKEEREKWYTAVCTNIEVLRCCSAGTEELIRRLKENQSRRQLPCSVGIAKLLLRWRCDSEQPIPSEGERFPWAKVVTALRKRMFLMHTSGFFSDEDEEKKSLFTMIAQVENINARLKNSSSGGTILMFAAAVGDLDIVKYIVEEKNADLDTRSLDGDVALIIAARCGFEDVCSYLLGKGASSSYENDYAESAVTESEDSFLVSRLFIK